MTTTLLTFLAIWWISGNQWDWKKTKFSHLHIEGRIWIASYGERRIWVITVWLPFATWLGQKGCSRLNIIALLLQIHITTHPSCSTPSFYSEEERNIWQRCRRMSEWCEEAIAGWKPNRYWQNRLQPADASQRKRNAKKRMWKYFIIYHHRHDKRLLVHRLICL